MKLFTKTLAILFACGILFTVFPQLAFAQEDDWTYEVDGGKAVITMYSGPEGDVTVPDKLGGYDVTVIGSDVFTTVAVTSLEIPDGVTEIDPGAFWECVALKSINIGAGNPDYRSEDGIVFSKDGTVLFHYPAAKDGAEYSVPEMVAQIGSSAFDHNQNLQSIMLTENITQIGASAFWRCVSLTGIEIPASVASVGDSAFANCSGITDIAVEEGNPSYMSADGVLLDKSGATLLQCPAGKTGSFTVPEGVTALEQDSFRGCSMLEEVRLAQSVKNIGACAFAYCDGLKSVDLGNVSAIGYAAFQGCTSLTGVTLPESVTEISEMAFDSCGAMTAAYFMGDMPALGNAVFQNTAQGFTVGYRDSRGQSWSGNTEYAAAPFYIVAFDSCGGSEVPDQMVIAGVAAARPDAPEYAGYVLNGWYADAACTQPWDFDSDMVTADTTLYAKWDAVLALVSSLTAGSITAGESFALTPNLTGGEWSYDADLLSLSGDTFTALKAGEVSIVYKVNGQSAEYKVVIEEKATDTVASEEAPRNNNLWIILACAAAAVAAAAVILVTVRKKKAK